MGLSANEVATIARIYARILAEQADLDRLHLEGPNAFAIGAGAAQRLVDSTIPQYKLIVPQEVQLQLRIDLDVLERRCQDYLTGRKRLTRP